MNDVNNLSTPNSQTPVGRVLFFWTRHIGSPGLKSQTRPTLSNNSKAPGFATFAIRLSSH
jgi:hypothetical protein